VQEGVPGREAQGLVRVVVLATPAVRSEFQHWRDQPKRERRPDTARSGTQNRLPRPA
jgi:hypothetical protein